MDLDNLEAVARRGVAERDSALGVHPKTLLDLVAEVRQLQDLNEGLEKQIDAEARHAALREGEWCPICTHFEIEDLIAALDGERDRADAAEAERDALAERVQFDAETIERAHELAEAIANHVEDGWPHTSACQGEPACCLCELLLITQPDRAPEGDEDA